MNQLSFLAGFAVLSTLIMSSQPVRDSAVFINEKVKTEEFNIHVESSNLKHSEPDSSRFSFTTLASGLDEPMEMAILPDYSIVIVERKGAVRYYDNDTKTLSTIAHLNVFSGIEDGLLGVAADPKFNENHWLYLYYGVGGNRNVSELARYEFKNKQLDITSKKVLLEVSTQRSYCCHSAGYLTFSSEGLLYLSIGDNTNAEEIEGHNPTDERPGRELADDQASTANSNDLRGKILRIKPEADGSYSIPDGNLFPKDGSQGRPEVFAMGLRNPFRISIDPKNHYVYWGDVGPDTEIQASEGKLSYDEINQARKPGFFGYPYFLGANEVFPKYDFATKKEGPGQDPAHPVNNSPNNTGVKNLPPAQPAMIWYGKGPSKNWPLVGKGGASAMAGPVYYIDLYKDAPYKLPEYYHGKLFIYDWVRKWIMAVTLDENGNYVSMEPFLPQLKVVAPMDMQITPDGAVYLLAYGTNWFAKNTDSGIIRVEYSEGNRNPVASAKASKLVGGVPLTVSFSGKESRDFDQNDKLTYEWTIGNKSFNGQDISHTFSKPGVYQVVLTVHDQNGGKSSSTTTVKVGNTPPEVNIKSKSNTSFYFEKGELDYQISVKDQEDKVIDNQKIAVSFNYIPFGKDLASGLSAGHGGNAEYAGAEKLYASLDCKACHTLDTKSIGPALKAVSKKYINKNGAAEMLASKIIKGGSGNWGTYPMPPHADLSSQEASLLANYILSLEAPQKSIPLNGSIKLTAHEGKGREGAYLLQASYTDKGANGIDPFTTKNQIVLRDPLIQMEDYEEGNAGVVIATKNTGFISYLANITNGKFVRFNQIDLKGLKSIRFRIQEQGAGGTLEVRQNSKDGILLGSITIPAGKVDDPILDWKEIDMPLTPSILKGDLYFLFKNLDSKGPLYHLDWMRFER